MDAAAKLLKIPKTADAVNLVCLTAASEQAGVQAAVHALSDKVTAGDAHIRSFCFAQGGSIAIAFTDDLFGWQPAASWQDQQHQIPQEDKQTSASTSARDNQILILDSICSLLEYLTSAEILQLISRLRRVADIQSILVTLQASKRTLNLQSQLKVQATGWCELHAPSRAVIAPDAHGTWVTTSCRRTGRLERTSEAFCLLENGSLRMLAPQPKGAAPVVTANPVAAQKGTVSRTEMEAAMEQARQGVVLPHEQLRKLGLAKPIFGEMVAAQAGLHQAGEGSIHYLRDSDSDHDSDEDPDDDLDM